MERELRQKGVSSLWHFTDINNLPTIYEQGGLLSKKKISERELGEKVNCGGNSLSHALDVHNRNWDKVSLSFIPHTPMFYGLKVERHFVLIEIDPSIVGERTFFSNTNATSNKHDRACGVEGISLVRFDAFKETSYSDYWQYYSQAEILVDDSVPQEYFKKIYFMSEASLAMGKFIAPGYENEYRSNFSLFEDFTSDNNKIPFIKKVVFTYQHINQSNYNYNFTEIMNLVLGKDIYFRVEFYPDQTGVISLKFKCKNGVTICEVSEKFQQSKYRESYFWSEPGEFDTSILRNYSELYVDVYINNVIYYQTLLSV